jgi:hypothetical protein
MNTKHFAKNGKFIGSFGSVMVYDRDENKRPKKDKAGKDIKLEKWPELPKDAQEVPNAPNDARATWDGAKWIEPIETEQNKIDQAKTQHVIKALLKKGIITEADLIAEVK